MSEIEKLLQETLTELEKNTLKCESGRPFTVWADTKMHLKARLDRPTRLG